LPKKRGMVAEMLGYARMDLVKGHVVLAIHRRSGRMQKLDRREAANFFIDIKMPDYDG
jgi:hypothetical protein